MSMFSQLCRSIWTKLELMAADSMQRPTSWLLRSWWRPMMEEVHLLRRFLRRKQERRTSVVTADRWSTIKPGVQVPPPTSHRRSDEQSAPRPASKPLVPSSGRQTWKLIATDNDNNESGPMKDDMNNRVAIVGSDSEDDGSDVEFVKQTYKPQSVPFTEEPAGTSGTGLPNS